MSRLTCPRRADALVVLFFFAVGAFDPFQTKTQIIIDKNTGIHAE